MIRERLTPIASSARALGARGSTRSNIARVITALAILLVAITVVGIEQSSSSHAAQLVPGCRTASPGSTTLALTVNGFKRTVVVHVPQATTNVLPLPLVLNLHGTDGSAAGQEALTNMDATSDAKNFIVAYPQALIPVTTGFAWNVPGFPLYGNKAVPLNAANDVVFLSHLPKILEQMYCIDPAAVYATGYSGGAREVSQLACEASNVFAAVAPVDGLRRPTPCSAKRAVPIIAFHGSADPINPFAGHGQSYWTYSVSTAALYWARQDRCSTRPTVAAPVPGVRLTSYTRCSQGSVVRLYEILGEGHQWPGGPPVSPAQIALLGPQSNALNANAVIWSFFASHRRN